MTLICSLLTITTSVASFLRSGNLIPISGHDYVEYSEVAEGTLICRRCGEISC